MKSHLHHKICMLSFDVEDWFQVEKLSPAIARADWESCQLRVEANVERLLGILRSCNTHATFFVLGWIAERASDLVAGIYSEGHEIASHGYGHELLYVQSEEQFQEDLLRSKNLLEDITKTEVIGYRAPGFSIVEYLPHVLERNGFDYDSSYFPSSFSGRYGKIGFRGVETGLSVGRLGNGMIEVPIATLDLLGKLPWGGGGYFRFYPYRVFKAGIRAFLKRKDGYLFYSHPWDLDSGQPKISDIPRMSKLLHYGFLSRTAGKLERLLQDFHFVPIRKGLKQLGLL